MNLIDAARLRAGGGLDAEDANGNGGQGIENKGSGETGRFRAPTISRPCGRANETLDFVWRKIRFILAVSQAAPRRRQKEKRELEARGSATSEASRNFFIWIGSNPLKSPESDE